MLIPFADQRSRMMAIAGIVIRTLVRLPLSRRCHNRAKLDDTPADLCGCFAHVRDVYRPVWDHLEHPESTSQAEYAGSIPVIGSTSEQPRRRFEPSQKGTLVPRPYPGSQAAPVRAPLPLPLSIPTTGVGRVLAIPRCWSG
jgi:hypothetical protein